MPHHIKRDRAMPPEFFAAEAASLRWLAEPGVIPIATVVEVGDDHLTLEHVTAAAPTPHNAETFGRQLAALHSAGAPAWGQGPPGCDRAYLGTLEQHNDPAAHWGEFFGRSRLLPAARLAADRGALSPGDLAAMERLCGTGRSRRTRRLARACRNGGAT